MLAASRTPPRPPPTAPSGPWPSSTRGSPSSPSALELVQAKYRLLPITRGDKAAVAFVESKAQGRRRGRLRRLLAEVYREQKDYAGPSGSLTELLKSEPQGLRPRGHAGPARRAPGDRAPASTERPRPRADAQRQGRRADPRVPRQFPNDLAFLQEECDLAARRGDLARATAITQEIDKVAKTRRSARSLRARLYAAQGRTREVADAYAEALERNPGAARRPPPARPDQPEARRGRRGAPPGQARPRRRPEPADAAPARGPGPGRAGRTPPRPPAAPREAVDLLAAAIKKQPEVRRRLPPDRRDPDDAGPAGRRGRRPSRPASRPSPTTPRAWPSSSSSSPSPAEARRQADPADGRRPGADRGGRRRARQEGEPDPRPGRRLPQGRPARPRPALGREGRRQARRARSSTSTTATSCSRSPSRPRATRPRRLPSTAVAQYDLVLKAQANSVEAINNKAWILHTHLGESRKALELAPGLLQRVDPRPSPASSSTPSARSRRRSGSPATPRSRTRRASASRPTTRC